MQGDEGGQHVLITIYNHHMKAKSHSMTSGSNIAFYIVKNHKKFFAVHKNYSKDLAVSSGN
jgi:hypothetical protein